jgi:hypothetical protein
MWTSFLTYIFLDFFFFYLFLFGISLHALGFPQVFTYPVILDLWKLFLYPTILARASNDKETAH